MKIVTVLGARPQFIKAAVVSRELRKFPEFQEIIIHTGQHYDKNMSDVFFKELDILSPNHNLEVKSTSNSQMVAGMLAKLDGILSSEKPNCVIVYGDTNSTLAGSLCAKQNSIPLVHIEAGLRSYNYSMPEEINRIVADRLSDYLFCPTQHAIDNLKKEGFENFSSKMILSGDVMYDAAKYYSQKSDDKSDILKRHSLSKFILATVHRSENVDITGNLSSIVKALNKINKQVPIVLPLHPRTKKRLSETGIKFSFETIEPVSYFDMIQLLKHSQLVITDSGGLQKEAFFFHKHSITLRNETEWTELVDNGFNVAAGTKEESILGAYELMKDKKSDFSVELYGKGNAGEIIVNYLKQNIH